MQPYKLISAATTNATSVKTSAGRLGGICAINLTASVRYLKLYDKASAPVVGTDVPVMTFPIPASTDGAGFVWPIPLIFGNGIAFAITGTSADNGTTAVGAGDVILNLAWE